MMPSKQRLQDKNINRTAAAATVATAFAASDAAIAIAAVTIPL